MLLIAAVSVQFRYDSQHLNHNKKDDNKHSDSNTDNREYQSGLCLAVHSVSFFLLNGKYDAQHAEHDTEQHAAADTAQGKNSHNQRSRSHIVLFLIRRLVRLVLGLILGLVLGLTLAVSARLTASSFPAAVILAEIAALAGPRLTLIYSGLTLICPGWP